MTETLYAMIEGARGKAEVFEVAQEVQPDAVQRLGQASSRPGDTRYEVRFAGQVQAF